MTHNKSLDFGVQSYCFRNFKDIPTMAGMVREIGLNSLEVCRAHADFYHFEEWKKVVHTLREEGIRILSIGVEDFIGDDREEALFQAAAEAGAQHISCHFKVDSFTRALPKVRQWSKSYGIRVGIHCHGGYQFGGSPDVLKHLIALGQPEIGLCIDTAWAMQIGPRQGNPVDWVNTFGSSVYGLHLKDFVFDKNGATRDAIVGEGTLQLKAFFDALQKNEFNGMAVVEYEGNVEDPIPSLKSCIESIRTQLR